MADRTFPARTGAIVEGSPRIALSTDPPFREYHFIDADPKRVAALRDLCGNRSDVHIHLGDCHDILTRDVLPRARWDMRRRALCLLDPYSIDLSWELVATTAQMKSVEIFVNFMFMDMNMNVLLRDSSKASPSQVARMDRFWGDRSWRDVAYEISPQGNLFDSPEEVKVENANEKIAEAYRRRLTEVAGFAYAARPLRFVNSLGRTIYYLFFASCNETGHDIVNGIFAKHRRKQGLS